MAEMKQNFAGGKMNKDVDERLVPNGEYRHAMNIQVSTSEGSDVGTVQNILGNEAVTMPSISNNSICVGSISDEKNDAFYWMVKEQYPSTTNSISQPRDIIFQHKNDTVTHVFVDMKSPMVAVFNNQNPTTGNLYIQQASAINTLSVGDILFDFVDDMGNSLGDDEVVIQSIDLNNQLINVGDYSNVNWAAGQLPQIYSFKVKKQNVLNFQDNIITGLNIIDDLLFWTDNVSEPKVINIPRCIQGTNPTGQQHTLFINEAVGIDDSSGIDIKEEHITVIKKSPKSVLQVKTETNLLHAEGETNSNLNFTDLSTGVLVTAGTSNFEITFNYGPNNPFGETVNVGDNIVLNNKYDANGGLVTITPPEYYLVSVSVTNIINLTSSFAQCEVIINSIDQNTPLFAGVYNWAVNNNKERTFKNKFPKFSYRYKYIDGEYSTYAPFTNVIFNPGDTFQYDTTEPYNIGMENRTSRIVLKGYDNNIPNGVVSIDLLYKESNSPSVYIVDTITFDDYWDGNIGFEVKPDITKAVLPENQLLRPFDNVPRKALAQAVSGSRIIYGNYLQNYNEENFQIRAELTNRHECDLSDDKKSLKSIRNYTLGISYLDSYGRQTPVFTNKSAEIEIPHEKASLYNQIIAQPFGDVPDWATHFKVFVKETSNEYYNMSMDRIYNAEDGNIWLAFPSSDRNKVDEETFLILKKSSDTQTAITEKNRYKIISIKNEAPEFIKTKKNFVAESNVNPSAPLGPPIHLFDIASNTPIKTHQRIDWRIDNWDSYEIPIEDIELPASVRFSVDLPGGGRNYTQFYEIMIVDRTNGTVGNETHYSIKLNKEIEEDFLEDAPNSGNMHPSLKMRIYRDIVRNSPIFDGRFFAKVKRDGLLNEKILNQATLEQQLSFQTESSAQFYYLADDDNPANNDDTTSVVTGSSKSDAKADWNTLLSPQTTTTDIQPMWFIDSAYFDGFYEEGSAGVNSGMWQHFGDAFATTPGYLSLNPFANTSGYNKGIYEENGKIYMDLAFGGLLPAEPRNTNVSLHSDNNDTTALNAGYDAWLATLTNAASGDSHSGDLVDFYQEIQDVDGTPRTMLKHWRVGSNENVNHVDQLDFAQKLVEGSKFRFQGDPDTIYTIMNDPTRKFCVNHYNAGAVHDIYINGLGLMGAGSAGTNMYQAVSDIFGDSNSGMHRLGHQNNRRVVYKIQLDKNPLNQTFNPIDPANSSATNAGAIQFVELDWMAPEDQIVPNNPAIWETEPKEDIDMEIYYEVDSTFPVEINNNTNYEFAPIGTVISHANQNVIAPGTVITGWQDNVMSLDQLQNDANVMSNPIGTTITFHRPDGSCVKASYKSMVGASSQGGANYYNQIEVDRQVSQNPINLSYFNCYSWGNGVESNRIRDDFNQVFIDKGVKASSTIEDTYKEERRKYGLIYSGLYNSTSGVNNLNQFIQAEKITKDINPTYGSIQKLHARDTDLITLCEDKILKILSNKDAVFNADNNPQLTATNSVLGQTVPFVGEYGISKNPESFSSESYRVYFSDKVRGAIMRLSLDGLTPISMHGMKDWFKDNLKLNDTIIGSYDDKKDEYNVTLQQTTDGDPLTVSFKEASKGWVSFKSFVPENAVSCANNYYTFKEGKAWKHHVEKFNSIGKEINRNTFYNVHNNSVVTAILNQTPGSVKSFTTLNYEGSKSRVQANFEDNQHYNLSNKKGWFVNNIVTDLEKGSINEFIKKEGKWFNYIKGKNIQVDGTTSNIVVDGLTGDSSFDQASFAIQGLGTLNTSPSPVLNAGCTDPSAPNFDPSAVINDGSCEVVLMGCLEPSASNYYIGNNTDDGSCLWIGCTCPSSLYPNGCTNETPFPAIAYTYGSNNIVDDGSCVGVVNGCTDPLAFNYNALANVDDGSCVPVVNGCIIASADNYNNTANTDDGTCTWTGCTQPLDTNYVPFPNAANTYVAFAGSQYGIQDDGSCVDGGCTDSSSANYDPTALWDDGSCTYCGFNTAMGSYNGIPVTTVVGNAATTTSNDGFVRVYTNMAAPHQPLSFSITDSNNSSNYGSYTSQSGSGYTEFPNLPADTYTLTVTGTPAACTYSETFTVGSSPQVLGCIDPTACNYNAAADTDNGSCEWTTCAGCNDSTADNYSTQTNSAFTPPLSNPANTPCYIPGTFNLGPCTINCGDGNSATDFGNFCCTYTSYGCTDPTAINYNDPANYTGNYTFVDDGSCVYDVYGCTDSTANNYNPLATIDDGSCNFTVNGCTDSNACNYDSFATNDDGSCVYGFNNVTIGDPATTDGNGTPVSTPVFYDDPANPVTTAKHFVFPVSTTTPYPNVNYTITDYFPADIMNETDIGLAFSSLSPTQYGASDKITIKLWKSNPNGPGFVLQKMKELPNPYPILDLQNFGNRVNSIPYGWGNMISVPSLNDTNNYEFEIYKPNGVTKEQYRVEIYSTINGVEYGEAWSSTANCGVNQTFEFTTLQQCDHPSAISGCTNPMACNYNPNATCFEPCQFPTNQNYMYDNDPNNPSVNICQPAPCTYAGTVYGDLQACYAANGGGV